MAARPIRSFPDPILKKKAKRVPGIDASVQQLIDDMFETTTQAGGCGLAAPQIGVSLRIIVLQMPDEEPVTLINPEVVKRSGEREVEEGCLSVPGYLGTIMRSVSVTVKGLNRQGKMVRLKGQRLLAQALEHELDHLNGILYLDHIKEPDKLSRVKREITSSSI